MTTTFRVPVTLMTADGEFTVPSWVNDHASFLEWLDSEDIPDDLRVCYLNEGVWIEAIPERAIAHNRIKTLVATVLTPLIDREGRGFYFGDGMTFTSVEGGFTTTPDGIFVSREAEQTDRARLVGGARSQGDTRLIGSPELMVEVVSPGSVDKDTEWLMSGYWNAGVKEYWLIDAQDVPLRFTIFRRRSKGFVAVRRAGGWSRSSVLGHDFRFVPAGTAFGHPNYTFEVR